MSRWQGTETEPWSHQTPYPPVVLLDDVVQILDLSQSGEAPQLALLLHPGHGLRIGEVLVARDRPPVHRVNVVSQNVQTLEDLAIRPTVLEDIIPSYLA